MFFRQKYEYLAATEVKEQSYKTFFSPGYLTVSCIAQILKRRVLGLVKKPN